MIRGINKNVMIYKNDTDSFFEQVIFIVKPEVTLRGVKETDIVSEANKIINQSIQNNFVFAQNVSYNNTKKSKFDRRKIWLYISISSGVLTLMAIGAFLLNMS